MKTKSLVVDIKEVPNHGPGTFVGYASVFGNRDSYGDVVIRGAFAKSLETFGPGGSGIPCYWGHQMGDPMMCIGWTTSAVEDDRGLKVQVQLDLDNPNAAQVHKLIKAGVVNQMSFAFDVKDHAFAESDELGHHVELRELDIFEVSVVQVGANRETELLDVKDRLAGVKAGRKISASNEDKLSKAQALISEVLESVQQDEETDDSADDGSDQEPKGDNDEERESVKSEDHLPVKSRTLSDADIAEIEIQLMEGA